MPTCWHRPLLKLPVKGHTCSASWIVSHFRQLHEDRLAFKYNEIVLAEHRKGKKRLFQLTTGGQFPSPQGIIPHVEIVGTAERSANFGPHQMLFYRPTLEDYVLHMKRGPAITYPKDAAAMMMMMDIGCGSKVLESGTGTGGLALFLSRAGTLKCLRLQTVNRKFNVIINLVCFEPG